MLFVKLPFALAATPFARIHTGPRRRDQRRRRRRHGRRRFLDSVFHRNDNRHVATADTDASKRLHRGSRWKRKKAVTKRRKPNRSVDRHYGKYRLFVFCVCVLLL